MSANFREFPVILSSSVREWYLRIGVGTREVDLATEKATKQSAHSASTVPERPRLRNKLTAKRINHSYELQIS